MVLDSSVLLAILQREPERELFLSQIDSAPRRLISAATVIEASIVVLSRHPAGLNFGDCFSYALAKASGEPLLFKGDDFSKTDIEPAA